MGLSSELLSSSELDSTFFFLGFFLGGALGLLYYLGRLGLLTTTGFLPGLGLDPQPILAIGFEPVPLGF